MRSWITKIHLYLGLVIALYAISVGVTGSILVFEDELNVAAYPQFHSGGMSSPGPASGHSILAEVRRQFPDYQVLSLTLPTPETPFWMTYLIGNGRALEVYSDPGSGRIVGARNPGTGWLGSVRSLHTNLMAGRLGRMASAFGAAGLLVLAISGVWLWWPGRRWRWTARDSHYGLGIAASWFIFALAATGLYFYIPQVYVRAVGSVLPRTGSPPIPVRSANTRLLLVDDWVKAAQNALPGRQIYRVQIVDRADQAVRVTFSEGAPEAFHLVSSVYLDPVDGEPLRISRLEERPAGDSVLTGLSIFHFGRFGGWIIKVLWSILGLTPGVLAITGFFMWRRKQRRIIRTVEIRIPAEVR